jgi:glucose/arabinose dehydrogenase
MNRRSARTGLALAALAPLALVAACSGSADKEPHRYGYNPQLPEPKQFLFPPMGLAKPVGWKGAMPTVPAGFAVQPFATDLHNPRNVLPLPNGDVIVVESGDPSLEPVLRPKGIIFGLALGKTHGETKPGNRLLLLQDTNHDGVADRQSVLAENLASPFGAVWTNGTLYVAATDAIWRWPYALGQTRLGAGTMLTDLPGGPIDHHWTKSLTLSPDGSRLYAGVGSNSNIVENGLEAERGRAAIWEIDPATGMKRLYATGLRNPNGLIFRPGSQTLYAVVNERDELGNNLVPDYLTSVRDGGFYGWPWSYYGQHVDARVMPRRPDMVARAIVPDYSLSAHVAPLGLTFAEGGNFPARYQGGAFVGEHGTWDRNQFNGYQVAFIPFINGKPAGNPEPFLSGFVAGKRSVHGRPVGLSFGADGALYVADDVGNAVWRVAWRGG